MIFWDKHVTTTQQIKKNTTTKYIQNNMPKRANIDVSEDVLKNVVNVCCKGS